ncbi:unnamed protein product [Parascedosporium putredinis]|uniref:Pathway-specific nitrogen regulator n=1 Tax=Parascedosporium putredinis TaxID=1442378 RepID=A0A9P1H8F2_9PEZI|nr:unnamed protein product [Parascedosporium putredinis]CAI7999733.1 unnamed protein product [Parascedosporium putredinis]
MTRVTQDFDDFTIHEDENSTHSAADDESEVPPQEVTPIRVSLGAESGDDEAMAEDVSRITDESNLDADIIPEGPEELVSGAASEPAAEDECHDTNEPLAEVEPVSEGAEEPASENATEDLTAAEPAELIPEPSAELLGEEVEEDAVEEGNPADLPQDTSELPPAEEEETDDLVQEVPEDASLHEAEAEIPDESNTSVDYQEESADTTNDGHDETDTPNNDFDDEEEEEEDTHNESGVSHDALGAEEDDAQEGDDEDSLDSESRRMSTMSGGYRRTSGRTDALIQAAARAVVARIENRRGSSKTHSLGGEEDFSMLSHDSDLHEDEDAEEAHDAELCDLRQYEASPRISDASSVPAPLADDVGNDSSSHNEADDDVFSDRSPRSSMGSISSDPDRKLSLEEAMSRAAHSPRISNISHYDGTEEDFVPTARNTPRLPFRTPSSVRAMQMSSPPGSTYGSPRSSKRHYPTISRLGSPNVSAQYSPKGRSTPSRLKERKEAPLVLLHVTLLPLRWPWGDVLETAEAHELSEASKSLRESWRQLHDRMGDTVLERGLPLRRKARILECGHYLGPSNIMTFESETESEDEGWGSDRRLSRIDEDDKFHWCNTCKHEIKYESLGPGKVFRVKVYASNGLMKAGAWGACWKEMERVDVEIEPLVDTSLQGELNDLATEQDRRAEEEEEARIAAEEMDEMDEEDTELGQPFDSSMMADHDHSRILSSPPASSMRMEQPSRSLVSRPQSRAVEPSPNPDMRMQEHHTSLAARQQQHQQHFETEPLDSTRMLSSPPPLPPSSAARASGSNLRIEDRAHSAELHHRQSHMMSSPCPSTLRYDDGTQSPAMGRSQSRSPSPAARRHEDSYMPGPSPASPSQEAFERREERREERRKTYQSASLPELILEAAKVVLQDRKNLVITLLGAIAMLLALRGSNNGGGGSADRYSVHNHFPPEPVEDAETPLDKEIRRIVETVTEVETVKVQVTATTTTTEMVRETVQDELLEDTASARDPVPEEQAAAEPPVVEDPVSGDEVLGKAAGVRDPSPGVVATDSLGESPSLEDAAAGADSAQHDEL